MMQIYKHSLIVTSAARFHRVALLALAPMRVGEVTNVGIGRCSANAMPGGEENSGRGGELLEGLSEGHVGKVKKKRCRRHEFLGIKRCDGEAGLKNVMLEEENSKRRS